MTRKEAKQLAEQIAFEVGAIRGTAFVGTWLNVPGIELTIHLDKSSHGKRYSIHNVVGKPHCLVRLIKGDGRQGRGPFHEDVVGSMTFEKSNLVLVIGSDILEASPARLA